MNLPAQYAWLEKEPGPRLLVEALKLYGIHETPGALNNAEIMRWAKETGLSRFYADDSTPWCGLYMAYVAMQAGWEPPMNPLWAQNWMKFGNPSYKPSLGDVLVFVREGGGHVGIYVGHDNEAFHVLGGNQSDMVTIKRIAKSRLVGARRCPWRISQPASVRPVFLTATGSLSTNEA